MPGLWVDPTAEAVIEAISAGDDVSPEDIIAAVAEASELLGALTGHRVHPAGVVTEEYTASPFATRLTPTWRPIREVIDILVVGADCTEYEMGTLWCLFNGSVQLRPRYNQLLQGGGARALLLVCGCVGPVENIRLTYRYGSTVTASARAALLAYARQLYLRDHPDSGECQLPERVTSVSREGLSYTVFDPQTYLDKGRTGVAVVDAFLSAVNPSRALRPAAVYTPDAPPGVSVPTGRVTRW